MNRREPGGIPPNTSLHMPAEWEPHEATWLAWPHELTDWPGKFSPIPWAFAEIARHLTQVERVFLIVEDRTAEVRARATLEKAGAILDAITFFHIPTDRGWMRDSGPIAVVATRRGEAGGEIPTIDNVAHAFRSEGVAGGEAPNLALLNFVFNGWAKYDDYKKDARVVAYANRKLKHLIPQARRSPERPSPGPREPYRSGDLGAPLVILPEHKKRRVILEGGAIDVNGCGTMLTTEECLLSDVQARNPGLTKFDYAQVFKKYLGVTNAIWLKRGIAGDDTHGHIDDLARFVDAKTVVAVVEENKADPNYEPLQENVWLLRAAKDQDGEPLRVETLPMPTPVYFAGQLLPASYANFYIANKIVLVPVFNDPADRIALNTLAALFPDREIIPIYCRDLVLGLGTIHCMTQQLPRL